MSADPNATPMSSKAPLAYLAPASIDVAALLPPPPGADSDEQKAELKLLERLQKNETDEQKRRVKAEDKFDVFSAFGGVMGEHFLAADLPATAKLFARIASDSKYFSGQAKDLWSRQRPPLVDDELRPSLKLDQDGSYPSGHATRGLLFAEVLASIAPPEVREKLIARGLEIGFDREIARVHFPSDVVAGRTLGHALARAFLTDAAFARDLSAAADEMRGAGVAVAPKSTPAILPATRPGS